MKIITKVMAIVLALSMLMLTGCGEEGSVASSSSAASKVESATLSSEAASNVSVNASSEAAGKSETAESTYNFTQNMNYLKINGRYAVTKAGEAANFAECIAFDHTANMVSFNADCEGDVAITMTIASPAEDGRETKYFLVVVDGVEKRVAAKGTKNAEVKLNLPVATGLKRGAHTFEIYRQTEANHGNCNLISVTMKGTLTDRPKDKDLYIEFLGDSITVGYGDLTTVEDTVQPSYPAKSSGTDTYAFLTAKALNADMSAVARSGLAFTWGRGDQTVYDFWGKTSYSRPELGDYKATRQPNVVVIALGTNDHQYASKGYTKAQLVEEAVKLMTQVKKDRPNAKIVWYYGILGNDLKTQIKSAVEQMGGTEKGFYYFEEKARKNGGNYHPSKSDHKAAAENLTAFLKTII